MTRKEIIERMLKMAENISMDSITLYVMTNRDLEVVAAAAALLKEQEPRVMALEEIPDAIFGWMEVSDRLIPCVLEDVYTDDTVGFANIEDGHDYMLASDYGKTWRVWTSEPTEEQRKAVKWK